MKFRYWLYQRGLLKITFASFVWIKGKTAPSTHVVMNAVAIAVANNSCKWLSTKFALFAGTESKT